MTYEKRIIIFYLSDLVANKYKTSAFLAIITALVRKKKYRFNLVECSSNEIINGPYSATSSLYHFTL